jgi:hypothetical protein
MGRFAKVDLGYFCCDGWRCVDCHRLKEGSGGVYSLCVLGVLCGACEDEGEAGIPAPPEPPAPELKGAAIALDAYGIGIVRFYGPDAEDHALAFLARKDAEEVRELPIDRAFDRLIDALYPQCEHGLDLALCAGPGHYPRDL